jgi:hypothetical protein
LTLSFEFEKEYHFKNPSTKKKREKRKNPGFFPKTHGYYIKPRVFANPAPPAPTLSVSAVPPPNTDKLMMMIEIEVCL